MWFALYEMFKLIDRTFLDSIVVLRKSFGKRFSGISLKIRGLGKLSCLVELGVVKLAVKSAHRHKLVVASSLYDLSLI